MSSFLGLFILLALFAGNHSNKVDCGIEQKILTNQEIEEHLKEGVAYKDVFYEYEINGIRERFNATSTRLYIFTNKNVNIKDLETKTCSYNHYGIPKENGCQVKEDASENARKNMKLLNIEAEEHNKKVEQCKIANGKY